MERKAVLTDEQIDLYVRKNCPGALPEEVAFFIEMVNRTGFDPYKGQIFAIMRWSSQKRRMELQVQSSVDGMRALANATGQYMGQTDPLWCGKDGIWRDVWLDTENTPAAAKVGVYRKGFAQPLVAVANFGAYAQTDKNGNINSTWKKYAAAMILKCFAEDTEVLTDRGFERFPDCKGTILQVTEKGLEPAPFATVFSQDYTGDMIVCNGKGLDFCVTPNHDMATMLGMVEAGGMFDEAQKGSRFGIPACTDDKSLAEQMFDTIEIGAEDLSVAKNPTNKVWCTAVPSGLIVVRRKDGMPMLCGNCAEALALRKAFPMELGGLYSVEEMARVNQDAEFEMQSQQPQQAPRPDIISEDQRRMLTKTALEFFGEQDKYATVKRCMKEVGFDSTRNMTQEAFYKVMEAMQDIYETRKKAFAEPQSEPIAEQASETLATAETAPSQQ